MSSCGPLRPLPWRRQAAQLGASLGVAAVALVACGDAPGPTEGSSAGGLREVVFTGICDASAAVPLDHRHFAVADDEDSTLRVYDADRGGEPLRSVDLSDALFPPAERNKGGKRGGKKKKRKKNKKGVEQAPGGASTQDRPRRAPESDIEAAVRVGDVAYWMTSHARDRKGKRKGARLLFFATTASDRDDALLLLGRSYEHLLADLLADARYAPFDLAGASELAPKDVGGLNLEGLGLRPEGGVWIGFRNPIPGGKALLAPLLNPERLIEGERARLGDPVLLDLGGLGIRELARWRGRTLIVAGPYAQGEESRLFSWDGRGTPLELSGLDLSGFHPEGFFAPESRDEILLLSDDGTVEIDGEECKRLDDPGRKRFRGRWIPLPPPRALGGAAAKMGRSPRKALRRGDFRPKTLQTSGVREGGMQSKDEILRWVVDTLKNEFQLRDEDLHPGAHLIDDLDLDSIDAVDLAVNVDQQLGLTLGEGDLKAIQTVQDVVDLIHGRLA